MKANIISRGWLFAAGMMALMVLTACETQFYDEEQYRKEIYIVSGDDNIFGQEYSYGQESVGYLSIYAGGTTAIDTDVEVELELYPEALRTYNQRIFGENYADYARMLEPEDYTIESMKVTLSKDNPDPYVQFPIKVNINNIEDDNAYYIPLRIKSVSNYMISPTRRNVLFRIYKKNDYATTKGNSYYTMNGLEQVFNEVDGEWVGDIPTAVNSTKPLVPISEHSVRLMPNALGATSSTVERNNSIVVTVHPDQIIDIPVLNEGIPTGEFLKRQLVTVSPWAVSANSIIVEEIADEPSYYDPDKQQFTLNYRYQQSGEKKWHKMNEVMIPLTVNN